MKKIISIFFFIAIVFPLLSLFYLSITYQWMFPKLWHEVFTLQHWLTFFSAENKFLSPVYHSFVLGIFQMTVINFLGFFTSRSVMYHPKASFLLGFSYYPFLISPLVFSILLLYFLMQLNLSGTILGVVIAQSLIIYPFSVLLHASFWSLKTKQLLFQASTLGANSTQIFFRILLPMALPQLLFGALVCFVLSWFDYAIVQSVGMSKVNTLTLATSIFLKESNPHLGAVAAILLLLPYFLVLIFSSLKKRFL